MNSDAAYPLLRVGRGITDVIGSLARVVLCNLSRVPITIRAGALLGYGFGVNPTEYECLGMADYSAEGARGDHHQGSATTHGVDVRVDDNRDRTDGQVKSAQAGEVPHVELGDVWPRLSD